MSTNLITTGKDVYLVKFQNSVYADITYWENIQESLKKLNEKHYLKEILRFDQSKDKFLKVPKNKYNLLFSANTEAIEILKANNLIK